MNIYPYPSKGIFTIDLGRKHSTITISVESSNGQEISKKTYQSVQTIEQVIEGVPGLYLVKIETEKGSHSRKITCAQYSNATL